MIKRSILPTSFDPLAVCAALGVEAKQVVGVTMSPSECIVELVVCDTEGGPCIQGKDILTTNIVLKRGGPVV